jgi:hypothetical protein
VTGRLRYISGTPEGPVLEVANEFSTVRVQRVKTRNGMRLRISSPKLDRAIDLDALALESLTWQSMETFSRFLATPFGPQEED